MKKERGKNWKSYCDKDCTQCNSIFFVKTASRYCYEDKFNLPQVPKKMVYKKHSEVHIIATGVIGHATYRSGTSVSAVLEDWEDNLELPIHMQQDKQVYILKEVCKEMKVNYSKFIRILNKITKELVK